MEGIAIDEQRPLRQNTSPAPVVQDQPVAPPQGTDSDGELDPNGFVPPPPEQFDPTDEWEDDYWHDDINIGE